MSQILTLPDPVLTLCHEASSGQSLPFRLTVKVSKEGDMPRDGAAVDKLERLRTTPWPTTGHRPVAPAAVLQRRRGEKSFTDMVIAIRPKLMEVTFHSTQSKVESEDIVSKTVIKMLEHEDQFMPGSNFAAWAITITRNVFLDGVARAKPHVPLMLTDPDGQHFDRPELVMHLAPMQESGIIAFEMAAEVDKLPQHQRDALKRAIYDGQGYNQIAQETEVSEGTVKARISRARSTLNNTDVGVKPPVYCKNARRATSCRRAAR